MTDRAPAQPSLLSRLQLTPEVIETPRRGHLWLTILGALLVVMLVNAAAGWYLGRSTSNLGYWLIQEKWRRLLDLDEDLDWLVLGDSSANQGVVSAVLEERLGGRALNLATIGDIGILDDAWMLQTYLQTHPAPRGVIVVHAYDIWEREPIVSLRGLIPLSPEALNELRPAVELDAQSNVDSLLTRYFPLYSRSTSLKSLVFKILRSPARLLKALGGAPAGAEPDAAPILDAGGYMAVLAPDPATVAIDYANHAGFVRSSSFRFSARNQQALEAMIALSEEVGFDLWLVNSPLYSGLAGDPNFQAYFDDLQQGINQLGAGRSSVFNLGLLGVYPESGMVSVDHAAHASALDFSARLAEAILAGQASR